MLNLKKKTLTEHKQQNTKWPKETKYYVHGSKEENWHLGEKLRLTENVISDQFRYTAYEIEFDLLVNEDGTNKVLKINNVDVSDKGISI